MTGSQAAQRYDVDITSRRQLNELQRLEQTYGSAVHDWIDEGMPREVMGTPHKMNAFRMRKETSAALDTETTETQSKTAIHARRLDHSEERPGDNDPDEELWPLPEGQQWAQEMRRIAQPPKRNPGRTQGLSTVLELVEWNREQRLTEIAKEINRIERQIPAIQARQEPAIQQARQTTVQTNREAATQVTHRTNQIQSMRQQIAQCQVELRQLGSQSAQKFLERRHLKQQNAEDTHQITQRSQQRTQTIAQIADKNDQLDQLRRQQQQLADENQRQTRRMRLRSPLWGENQAKHEIQQQIRRLQQSGQQRRAEMQTIQQALQNIRMA